MATKVKYRFVRLADKLLPKDVYLFDHRDTLNEGHTFITECEDAAAAERLMTYLNNVLEAIQAGKASVARGNRRNRRRV